MADRNEVIRIILEAKDNLSGVTSRAFGSARKDADDYRKVLADVRKEGDAFSASITKAARNLERNPLFTTFFERQTEQARRAIIAIREFREEARKEFAARQRGPVGELIGGFTSVRQEARLIDEAVRKRISGAKEEVEIRRRALEEEILKEESALRGRFFAKDQDLRREQAERRRELDFEIRQQRQSANELRAIRERLTKEDSVLFSKRIETLLREEQNIRNKISSQLEERNLQEQAEKNAQREEERQERALLRITQREQRRAIVAPNIFDVRREESARIEQSLENIDNRLRRIGVTAARTWGNFRTGITAGRRELSDLERESLRSEGRFTKLGVAIGRAVSGATSFVNVRWAIVISFLQILGTLLVQGGTALVALASSAIQAASALGGALFPAIAQLIPIVGLLTASFQRLGAVLDASKIAEKLRLSETSDQAERIDGITQATQRLSDARQAALRAAEAIGDAEFNLVEANRAVRDAYKEQKEAVEDLAEARRQAARDIVDANLEEKEAALALEEAELAVLDAKRRLREEQQRDIDQAQDIEQARANVREAQARLEQVRREGDQAEISTALQNLAIAEQNVQAINNQIDESQNAIKDAELGVRRSQINLEQARIRNKRAQQDAEELRRQGVKNSERVINAQESLEAATRGIAAAQRQQVLATRAVRDAIFAASVASREERNARKAVADATKDQTAAQKNLQETLSDLSPAETRLFRSIERIRERYRQIFRPITDIIISAFARAVDRAAILLEDPKLQAAARTLATAIGNAVDVISRFTLTPEFKRFLEFSINEAAKNIPILTRSFLNLFRIFMRIAQGAGPLLTRLFERFEQFTIRLEQRSRNREGVEKFFSVAERHLNSWLAFIVAAGKLLGIVIKLSAPSGQTLLDALTNKLNEWTNWLDENEDRVLIFFDNVAESVTALASSLGLALKVLFEAFSSEQASALTQFVLEVFIPAFKLFIDLLGFAAQAFIALTDIPLIGELIRFVAILAVTEKLFNRLIPATQKLTNLFFALVTKGFKGFIDVLIKEFPVAAKIFQEAILRTQILLIRMTAAIRASTVAIFLHAQAVKAIPYVRAIIIIAAVVTALIALELKFQAVTKTVKAVDRVFRSTFNWIRDNWKLLAVILISPFAGIVLAVTKFRNQIITAAQTVINFFRGEWGRILALAIISPFSLAINFAVKFGADLIQGLIDGIKSKATDLKNTILDVVKSPWEAVKSFFGIFSPSAWTRIEIGRPMGEGIGEGAKEGIQGLGSELTLALRGELRSVENEANNVRDRILGSLTGLRSLVSSQLGLKLQGLTPAEKELQALDQQEAERGRKQQLADAANSVKDAQKEVEKAQRDVVRKQKAFNNAKTNEQKRQAREELKFAKQSLESAQRQLEDARKQEIEIERQVGVDRRRERLNQLAQEQREALEKSIQAEENRADKMFQALRNALRNKDWALVQKIFDQIVNLVGIKNLGKATADSYVDGLINQLKARQKDVDKGFAIQQKQTAIAARRERQAAQILEEAGPTARVPRDRGAPAATDLETLRFLLESGQITEELALTIIRRLSKSTAVTAARRTLKNFDFNLDSNDLKVLQEIEKENLLTKAPKDALAKIVRKITPQQDVLRAFARAISSLQIFQGGGSVQGGEGSPVPIIAHAGEWVLNKAQQTKLAQRLGENVEQLKNYIFGTNMGQGKPGPQTTGTKSTKKEQGFRGAFFNLVPQEDPDGVVVWFIEMDDGAFGQVSPRDARRIKASNGNWIPGYVKRSTHGFTQKFLPPQLGRGLAKGGVVMPSFSLGGVVQSFAEGGTVLSQIGGVASPPSIQKNINQNFEVKTQGETDWNYVLRLSAIHAQESL